ncbi:UDP-glucose 4-epimerase GalE [Bacillaceae bacterium SIJ1]|uniref:UDP-glucose 4-epimerase GalE n=1 Tax=Litoribacterium kuwaitense TaxID=1398745 RepID=UPI0013E9DB95|nr:UDP-glucose 4-epimerase GalE [Litoribacterium kuwaitense]NGP43971.1 UDP-glucose 4-epimerase GalE [Litoribacterium kuwaitense]
MSILVTGGAGYIGSHTVEYMKEQGKDIIVFDNVRTGHRESVQGTTMIEGDLLHKDQLEHVFSTYDIDAVVHFAARSLVGESVEDPLAYYENNVVGTFNLINTMVKHGVKKIVFSSTAATYGNPEDVPIKENAPTVPTNPYGETKLAIERMLHWCEKAYGLKSVSLRYFNAAGASPKGTIGEDHTVETHLIPIILQVALGKRESISIFGDDYETEDGTCVRDYIHVMDLASAHDLALEYLEHGGESDIFNLGNGQGFSVLEVIDTCRQVTEHPIPAKTAPRRAGDPAILIASADRAQRDLGWTPQYPALNNIVEHAWRWHKAHPNGY